MMFSELKKEMEANTHPTNEQIRKWLLELVAEVDDLDYDVRKKFRDLEDISKF